jgi:hypothetical protein
MHLFTLDEARRLLETLRPALVELSEVATRLHELQRIAETAARGSTADGNALADPWAEEGTDPLPALYARFRELVRRFEAEGVEVKDPSRGLIDFAHSRDGRVVYLCYHLGEPGIATWHPLETGFAGRRPL